MEHTIQSDRDIRCEFLNIFKFIRAACGVESLGETQHIPEPENTNSSNLAVHQVPTQN